MSINVSRFSCKIADLYLLPVLCKDFTYVFLLFVLCYRNSLLFFTLLPSPLSLSHVFCLSYSVYSMPAFFSAEPRRVKDWRRIFYACNGKQVCTSLRYFRRREIQRLSLSLSLSFCQPFPPIGAKIDSWNRRNSRNETEIAEHVVLFSMDVLWFVVWNSIGDTEFYFWNARWTLL